MGASALFSQDKRLEPVILAVFGEFCLKSWVNRNGRTIMKAFVRGLLWGTIGSVVVLGLAIGVCYFSGLLDFAGGEREALSST